MQVSLASAMPTTRRRNRSPQHPFNIMAKPYQIQPFMIAPVLPGETMKNLMCMARCVSDPLKDKLMGWWYETYFFYVKHTDLDIADQLVNMHLNAQADTSALFGAADPKNFHSFGINYVKACLDSVVKWYFRDADDATIHTLDGQPIAKIGADGWWQSAKVHTDVPVNDDNLPGDAPSIPDHIPPGFEQHYAQWEMMRAASLTAATFEDYLSTFGVKTPQDNSRDEEMKRPELLRYSKEFTYPTNTVDPATGKPSSAAVWSVSARAEKDRFFREPGFIIGVQVIRPKVLLSRIAGTLTSFMYGALDWLPALLRDEPFTSLRQFANNTGPLPVNWGDSYWVDMKDLFIHGEQFRNHDLSAQGNSVVLPTWRDAPDHLDTDYVTQADVDAMFVGATAAERFFRTDGLVTLAIASPVHKDTSL